MKWLALALLLGADGGAAGHEHCWHVASFQHAVEAHLDEVCCHCGKPRCRDASGDRCRRGHGPHDPFRSPWCDVRPDGGA